MNPRELQAIDAGVAIGLVASIINYAVARYLLTQARRTESIILEADGQHLMTDVATSIGVLVGMGLAWMTSLYWIDPVVALRIE